MTLAITPGLVAELRRFNRAQAISRAAYYLDTATGGECDRGMCTPTTTCAACRRQALADLRVATSVEECAALLEVLDKPGSLRGRAATRPCGTDAARRRHRRQGEDCPDCRVDQADRTTCERCGDAMTRKKAGGYPKRFCSRRCRVASPRKAPE